MEHWVYAGSDNGILLHSTSAGSVQVVSMWLICTHYRAKPIASEGGKSDEFRTHWVLTLLCSGPQVSYYGAHYEDWPDIIKYE